MASAEAAVPSSSSSSSFDAVLSSALWELDAAATGGAQGNAGTAAAAAAAIAAAAAATRASSCSVSPAAAQLLPPKALAGMSADALLDTVPSGSTSNSNEVEGRHIRRAAAGAAALARAAFKPRVLHAALGLLPELLAPQRIAIAAAVIDNALRIGERSVAVGPSCELDNSSSTGSSSRRGRALAMATGLLAAVPTAVSGRLLDAAVAAGASVLSAPRSRQHILHAADTLLALVAVQQELQQHQQQRAEQHRTEMAGTAGSRASSPLAGTRVHAAAAVVSCALGDAHSCVEAEQSRSGPGKAVLLATVLGLHVALIRDACALWWAFHTGLVLHAARQP